jgi:hypothetical protein
VIACVLLVIGTPARGVALDEFPRSNAWARVTPSVVWCGDATSTVKIEVHIIGRTDVAGVQVTNLDEQDRITLYDDGTHGDAAAGDNVFTSTGVQLACNPGGLKYGKTIGRWLGFLRVRLKDGREQGNNYGIAAGVVNPGYKNVFAVRQYGSGLSVTAYAFFIDDSSHEVMDDYPVADVHCGTTNFRAFQKLYSVFSGDPFDLALLTPGLELLRPTTFGENVPYQVQVRNEVQHIGWPLKNNAALFGSAGRLKSVIYHSFGSIQIFDHEIGHTWGAGIGASLGLLEEGGGGHWAALSDIGGQLGYYYFDDQGHVGHFSYNGDGTWRLIPNNQNEPYSPLELYVMGLIPPEQVPPIHILTSPNLSDPQRITAASVRTLTIQQIMAAEGGGRVPNDATSPKLFNLAYLVTQDGPYHDAAYAYFSLMSHALMSRAGPEPKDMYAPFYWATGGRAALNTRLPVDLPEPFKLLYLPMVLK